MRRIGIGRWRSTLAFVSLSFGGFFLGGFEVGIAGAVLAAALAATARSQRRRVLGVRETERWRLALGHVAGSLAAGTDLLRAWENGVVAPSDDEKSWETRRNDPAVRLRLAARMARLGGDPSEVIRSNQPISRYLAICLAVSRRLGIATRPMLLDLAEAAAQRQQVARDVGIALASARATARLLAALPAFGIALAELMSPRALPVLFGDQIGRWCLTAAATLEAAGLVWVERISDGAVR